MVVDVLRAFTTAACAFDQGAKEIYLVSAVEEAFALREQHADLLLVGEVNGYPIAGFDYPNSPATINRLNLKNRRMVLRTTAGTQGVVRCARARHLYVASLCVAKTTAASIAELKPDIVSFVNTGVRDKGGGEEDVACSAYISSLLQDIPLSITDIQQRVLSSKAAAKFTDPDDGDFSSTDLEHALKFNHFPFAMKVSRIEGNLVLQRSDANPD